MSDPDAFGASAGLIPSNRTESSEGTGAAGELVFADGKSADAFRTIGEVAKILGIRQHVLRYWEDQFPMLRPVKRSGGRRYYRPEDVSLVQRINELVHGQGYTLRGARLAIEAGGKAVRSAAPTTAVSDSTPATAVPDAPMLISPNVLSELRAIRARLAAALAD